MNYEPMLSFNCEHSFYDVGEPTYRWASSGTNTIPPKDAPFYQKQRCLNCGGVREICKRRPNDLVKH